jgi:anaerobic selenocysteine-containing dehydrogenase
MAEVDIYAEGVEVKKSACYFCHQNCGVLAYVKDGDVIKIEGDLNYTNAGGLCCRGNVALQHVNHPARINHALKRVGEKGENKWEQIPWDQAIKEIAEKLNQIKEESGAEAVAVTGGTTRTDDWARRRWMNIFGTPNGFHNALLCWIPTFMIETAISGWSPFETELGNSRVVILWGMNPGASTMPGMKGYTDLQMNGLKIIVVDPRYSETAGKADLWLPLRPGSDTALSLAMLHVILFEGLYDNDFVENWCTGFNELLEHMMQYTPEWAAPITWLDPEQIRAAARMYAKNKPGNIQWGCTWDQLGPTSGTGSHARALMRAVTGNLDCMGGDLMPGPSMTFLTDEELEANDLLPEEQKAKQIGSDKFKLTSWPGYQKIRDTAIATWGKAPTAEWMCEAHGPSVFKAILTGDPYQVRALMVMSTNPINSYGDAKMTLAALKAVEFMVTVDYWMTPSALYSDYVIPAAGALERPIMHTNYGVTDSILCSQRAIQPKFDRHDDFTFWKELSLAGGADPSLWPWETLEDAYYDVIKPLGYPVQTYDEFVENYRMYFPPQHFDKYRNTGFGFWTQTRKVELKSSVLEELGYPGMPTYVPCAENEIDNPELAEEYPIVLTTGGGFMPYHHSEHFQMPTIRYLYPDPYFTINPELAEKLEIEDGDWCWIETRRGRIRQRADVQPLVDPRVVFVPRGWWFPERGVDDPEAPFGCLQSNTNVLTSVDDEHCDPIGGSWANRGLMCKVYKCTELELKAKQETEWSIPGSSSEPGITVPPSQQKLAFDPIPFTPPEPEIEVPEDLAWDYHRNVLYQPGTGYVFNQESGWLVDERTQTYYDRYSGWRYDAAQELLADDATGKFYTFDRVEVPFISGVRCYPGQEAPYEVPGILKWDAEKGYATFEGDYGAGKIYDSNSGWVVGEDGVWYEAYYGYAFDPTQNNLVNMTTGERYTMDYQPIAAAE